MDSNLERYNPRLTEEEEVEFRKLTNKILGQHSSREVLSDEEKEKFSQLLLKLELLPQKHQLTKGQEKIIKIVYGIFVLILVFSVFVGIPALIAWIITESTVETILTTILAVVGVFLLMVASYSKLNLGAVMTTILLLICIWLVILLLIS